MLAKTSSFVSYLPATNLIDGSKESLQYQIDNKTLYAPLTSFVPGKLTDARTIPPVKQNLFQVESSPLVKLKLFISLSDKVISKEPFLVVT